MATLCEVFLISVRGNSWKTSGFRTFLEAAGETGCQHDRSLRRLYPQSLTTATRKDLETSNQRSDRHGIGDIFCLDDGDPHDEKHRGNVHPSDVGLREHGTEMHTVSEM
jgi:hypothetical protein